MQTEMMLPPEPRRPERPTRIRHANQARPHAFHSYPLHLPCGVTTRVALARDWRRVYRCPKCKLIMCACPK